MSDSSPTYSPQKLSNNLMSPDSFPNSPEKEAIAYREVPTVHVMAEDEVRTILAEFNQNMNVVLIENEGLKTRVDELAKENRFADDKLKAMQSENKILNEERNHFQELYNQNEVKLRQKEKEVIEAGMETAKEITNIDLTDKLAKYREIVEATVEADENKEVLLGLIQEFEKMKQDVTDFSQKYEHLAKENEELKEELGRVNQEQTSFKNCMRCREKFSPLLNTDQSCFYHFGKLKYYSCRGCGADEYWSCCNKCTVCNKGCREGKHISA